MTLRKTLDLVAGAILLSGVGWGLFWTPTPNRVVFDIVSPEDDFVLQIYPLYDRLGLRDYFEFRSATEMVHAGKGVRQRYFSLPGGKGLEEIRIDARPEGAEFEIQEITFTRQFLFGEVAIGKIPGSAVADALKPAGGVVDRVRARSTVLIAGGPGAGWFLPASEVSWIPLTGRETRGLRLYRIAVAAVVAGCFFLVCRWISGVRVAGVEDGRTRIRGRILLFPLWLVGLAFLVYKPFLLFQEFFLFQDVARDSVDAFWPMFAHLGEIWRSEGVPFWSFSAGLGMPVFGWVGDPFLFLLWLFPPDAVPFGMGWVQFLKVCGAGGFFFLWLRSVGLAPVASALGAAGLAFSGHMTIRGAWFHYATEVFLVAFALWAIERYVRGRHRFAFVLAVALFCSRGPYGLALWSVLFALYLSGRLWVRREVLVGGLLRAAPFFLLGVGIGAVLWMPNLAVLLASDRLGGAGATTGSLVGRAVFDLNPPKEWLSSLAGLFAPDLLGKGNYYSGWRNYLEGPHLYAGSLMLLLVPQAFRGRVVRVRVALALLLAAVLVYLLVPHVRFLLNAYSVSYYKTSSFWVVLALGGVSALGLDGLLRGKARIGPLFWATLIGLAGLLLWLRFGDFPGRFVRIAESRLVWQQVFLLLPAYGLCLWLLAGRRAGRTPTPDPFESQPGAGESAGRTALRRTGLLLLLGLFSWEVVTFAGGVYRNRLAVPATVATTGGLYADDAAAAMEFIHAGDPGIFRVARHEMSVHLNDALLQGYFGLRSYNSFQPASVMRFLGREGFDAPYRYEGGGGY